MKVFFFEPLTINIPHYGTCLELMIDHLNAGDEVFFVGCDAELSSCEVNFEHTPEICKECKGRKQEGLKRISKYGDIKVFNLSAFISDIDKETLKHDYHFNNVEEVKKFSFEDFTDVGYGVASSLISIIRDTEPDTMANADLINRFIYSSKLVYKAIGNALDKIKPDKVYAYNGRYSTLRPVITLCKKKGIDIFLHEAGSDLAKYLLTKNSLLHEISYMQQLIQNLWNESPEDEEAKKQKAKEFYLERRKGVIKNWHSFTDKHIWELPADWDAQKYNIAIFTSSEDEFAAIGDSWNQPVYASQHEGIDEIAHSLENEKNIQVWVRLHPNLKTASPKLLEPYTAIDSPVIKLLMPDSPVSSYLLMDNADKVASFGSTMGIEAAFWGKPSVLLGNSFYRGFGAVHETSSHEESIKLLLDKELKPLDNLAAIKYGYYFGNYGIPYKHFKKTGIFTGTIENWNFSVPQKPQGLLQKLKKVFS